MTEAHKKLYIEIGVISGLALLLGYILFHMLSAPKADGPPPATVGQLLGQDEQGLAGNVPGASNAGAGVGARARRALARLKRKKAKA